METRFFTPALVFMMKYFFDVEKEITQQLLFTAHIRLAECKDVMLQVFHTVQR